MKTTKTVKLPTGISLDNVGRYYGRYYEFDLEKNKKIQKRTKFFKLKRDAVQALAELKSKAPQSRNEALKLFHTNDNKNQIIFDDVFQQFLVLYKTEVKPSSYAMMRKMYELHVKSYFGDYDLYQITNSELQKLRLNLIAKNYSSSYIKSAFLVINAVYKYANTYLNLQYHPKIQLNLKSKKKRDNFITKEEYEVFISNIENARDRLIFEILYLTGMRIGELSALQWKDVEDNVIKISKTASFNENRRAIISDTTKTYKERKITIPLKLKNSLDNYYVQIAKTPKFNNSFYIVGGYRFLTPNYIQNIYKKYRIYEHLTIHGFRHSHASYLINNNIPISDVAKRLGHKNIGTTINVYSHFFKNNENNIIQLLEI